MTSEPAERLLIVLPTPEPKESLERMKQKFPSVDVTFIQSGTSNSAGWGKDEPDKEIYKDKTILVTLSALPPTPEDAPNLKLIHFVSSGTNHVAKHPFYTDSSVSLTTSRGIAGPPIAEWVIMTALVHFHKYDRIAELQRESKWGAHGEFWSVKDMVGQRIGILGYGGIGRHVGRVAKAMGMDVYAFTASPKDTPEKRRDTGYYVPNTGDPDGSIPSKWYSGLDKPSLHEFLKQDLDIVVLSLPLTEQTKHLFSTEEFEILSQRKPFLTNISRGGVIDQAALIKALEDGKLRGAAVDVTDPEPLPENDPLWKAPNIVISPHMSGLVSNYVERAFEVLEANLDRKLKGEKLINLVNRDNGY